MSAQLCCGAEKLCPKSRAFSGHSGPKDGVASLAYGRLMAGGAAGASASSFPKMLTDLANAGVRFDVSFAFLMVRPLAHVRASS